ncbi:histidine phosphatase family protein [Sphingomonas ginsenosidivorax]|nr:histidine phosphatase family protein [Sphingomonas ginsenosidivorax]
MKVVLLCHGVTASMRTGGFPAVDEPVEGAARPFGRFDRVAVSPARVAQDTAALLCAAPVVVAALRDIDHGRWTGRSFADVHADAPDALTDWLARPWLGTPEGEDFAAVCARVDGWIGGLADAELPEAVVTHPMVIRAILAVTIGIAVEPVMRINVAPLSSVVLSRHRGWRLQQIGGRLEG